MGRQSLPQLQELQPTQIVQNTLNRGLNIAINRLEKFLESSEFEAGIEIAFGTKGNTATARTAVPIPTPPNPGSQPRLSIGSLDQFRKISLQMVI